ncbi:hypothetical protein DPX16_23202 [Anabarilius grahami]|uniref:Uncharacterized protein n=1 Tax=Anabarilius grahami TaxID=495550 RepID=A0A3N0YRL4_ANAGA|nr:hypothetical protein DPX16_23202 [Anabarilius grahami]
MTSCFARQDPCSSSGTQDRYLDDMGNNGGANISERLIESEGTGPAAAAAAPVSTRGRVQTERITSVPAAVGELEVYTRLPLESQGTPCASMQPSMDKSRESSNKPPRLVEPGKRWEHSELGASPTPHKLTKTLNKPPDE